MTAENGDRLVSDYLARLGTALGGLPADRRQEIVDEISSHIHEERAKLADESDTDVLNLLDRVGEPAEIAAEAAGVEALPAPARARGWGALEVAALILTPFLWPVGVILLWLSPAWGVRDKLIGTLLPPGGYLTLVFVAPALLLGTASVCSGGTNGDVVYPETCTGVAALPQWEQIIVGVGIGVGLLLLTLLPVLVAVYLAIQLRRGANARVRAQNQPPNAGPAWTERSATIP